MSERSVIAYPAQCFTPPGPAHDLFTCPEALRDLYSDVTRFNQRDVALGTEDHKLHQNEQRTKIE